MDFRVVFAKYEFVSTQGTAKKIADRFYRFHKSV